MKTCSRGSRAQPLKEFEKGSPFDQIVVLGTLWSIVHPGRDSMFLLGSAVQKGSERETSPFDVVPFTDIRVANQLSMSMHGRSFSAPAEGLEPAGFS